MLKKLRIKFIVINMTIVTIMMVFIFCLLYYSTSRNLERESMQMMNSIAVNPMYIAELNAEEVEGVRLPYFSVVVNHAGETTEIGGGFFDLSNDDFLQEIVDNTLNAHTDSGVLNNYNLRFLRTETPMGQCLVFADITSEHSILRHMLQSFAITGGIAFLVFLGISMLLARWAVGPVEKAWKQQKQFVADASHELKTPLTVIMTDAELLTAEECAAAERRQLTGSILTMSKQMRGLVESLLTLARIDNGSLQSEMTELNFSDLLEESVMLFEPLFFEKGMLFSYEIAPEIVMKANRAHLKQLPEIFLDNAQKYATPGGKTILSCQRISAKKCLLSVANQGEPIQPEEMENLFKRFYRADKARTGRQGYGIGLSIAESIALEHRGKIWAESRNGYNSFYVELPCI